MPASKRYTENNKEKCPTMPLAGGKKKIQSEISHQQSTVTKKYKRTCSTVLNVLAYPAIKIFPSYSL